MTPVRATSDVSVEIMELSPDDARDLLAKNVNNRKLRPTVVSRYAADMAAGRWDLTGDSIKLSWEDEIIDGQHRLHAIVASGATIKTAVAFGVDPKAKEAVDTGLKRGLGDVLAWKGKANAAKLSSAIAVAWQIEHGLVVAQTRPTHHEAVDWFEANPGIEWALGQAEKVRRSLRLPDSAVAAVVYHAARLGSPDKAEAFASQIATGLNMTERSPVYALRRWVMGQPQGRFDRVTLTAILVKAWNAYVADREVTMLAWRRGGKSPEPFPTMIAG